MQLKEHTVLGLYSDQAAFAIEAAIIQTDGLDIQHVHRALIRPYPHELREQLLLYTTRTDNEPSFFNTLNHDVSQFFIQVAQEILEDFRPQHIEVDLIGLSGHSAIHNSSEKLHLNFGTPQTLANALKLPVVHHFVKEDMNAGGVGSPLLATFWQAICESHEKPLAIVGLGGVSHLVYLGPMGELVGFDIGQGLELLDRWVIRHTGQELDFDGILAAKGTPDERVLKALLNTPYLLKIPPKSVCREDFAKVLEQVEGLSPQDGAATLTRFVTESIVQAQHFLPMPPVKWIFIGGGTYNATLMLQLSQALPNVQTAKQALPYTDALNAMGFAFIATRHLMGLPITFPSTTGVAEPLSGGAITYPE